MLDRICREGELGGPQLADVLALACRELTLKKGDIVYIHKEVDKNWLEGEHHGRLGIFPANYVEVSRSQQEPRGAVRCADPLSIHGFSPELATTSHRFSKTRNCELQGRGHVSASFIILAPTAWPSTLPVLRKYLLNEG